METFFHFYFSYLEIKTSCACHTSQVAGIRIQWFSGRLSVWEAQSLGNTNKAIKNWGAAFCKGRGISVSATPHYLTQTCAYDLLLAWKDSLDTLPTLGPCHLSEDG